MNLIEVKQRGWNVREHIKISLSPYVRDRDCFEYWNPSYLKLTGRKSDRKEFAKAFSECIKKEWDDDALELINRMRNKGITSDFTKIFEIAFGSRIFQCADCSHYFYDHDYHNVQDDFGVCGSCVSSYYWSEYHEYYTSDPDYDEDEDEDDGGGDEDEE